MGTLDKHAKEVMDDNAAQASDSKDGAGGFIILFFIIGFAASMVLGWVIFPKLLYSEKQQPFSFNHALHVGEVDEGCESCHFFRDDGSFSGIPKLAQCTDCHEEPMGETEDEAIFVEQYVAMEREVPWLVYSRQPDCVFFSHAAHVMGAKMDCVTCHGHIGESTESRPYEYNLITRYSRDIWGKNIAGMKKNSWDRMKMDDCAQCHKEAGLTHTSSVQTGRDACFVCHK
ncbi:menaquinone reductase multiheme cytochrome c subunit QrcA [uncultured Desulfosarcina sp.]|uniref:menaquinone reductase multiheme cytochrome c subunit QrcA n=1 Tax=uncultured Desulfosarcina sp. TaxID=218289 RepID=UPI0029C752B9|nr:menaquinone reductase multiheme cytochrome c subunit QrcA [uncultured Desulfosarcina sp.]